MKTYSNDTKSGPQSGPNVPFSKIYTKSGRGAAHVEIKMEQSGRFAAKNGPKKKLDTEGLTYTYCNDHFKGVHMLTVKEIRQNEKPAKFAARTKKNSTERKTASEIAAEEINQQSPVVLFDLCQIV